MVPASSFSSRLLACTALGVVLASASGPAARAQSSQPAQLPAISVEGTAPAENYQVERPASPKYTQPLIDTPQTITVVPKEILEEQHVTNLRDAIRYVPGVTALAGEGGGTRGDQFRIRGFNASTDIFVDGMREITQYTREAFFLEQIEVSKGPAGAYAGRGATGGAINLVSKMPTLESFYAGDLAAGSDASLRAVADINVPLATEGFGGLKGAALRLNVLAHEAEVAGRDVTETERYGFFPSFAVGLGTPTRFTASYLRLEQDSIPDYGLPSVAGAPLPVDRENFYGFEGLNTEQSSLDVYTVGLTHDVNPNLSLQTRFRYTTNDFFQIVSIPRNGNIAANAVTRNPSVRDQATEILANQTDATANFATGFIRHSLVGGVELTREIIDQTAHTVANAPADNLFNPNPNTAFTGTITKGNVTESEAQTIGLYAFDTLELSPRWQILGGLRWDQFDFDAFTPATGAASSQKDDMLSWRAGVVFKPMPNGSVYAAYGTSFNPSAEALSLNANLVNVDPEETRSYEVGTKWDVLGERLSLTAAAFRSEKTNARTPGLPGEPPQVLAGEQYVQGVELGVAGSLTRRWQVFGGIVFSDSEIEKSNTAAEVGKEVPHTPNRSASLWTTYQLPYGLTAGFGVQYLNDRFTNNANTGLIDGYTIYDAMLSYAVSDNVDLRLNIYNLTDEFYIERSHAGGAHVIPGPTRYAVLSTSFRF